MNLIAHLFPAISVNHVFAALDRAEYDISQIPVQFDSRVLRPGETSSTKNSDRHLEISAELLTHHIRRYFGGAEHGMQAVVDRHRLVDAVAAVRVIVSLLQFFQ